MSKNKDINSNTNSVQEVVEQRKTRITTIVEIALFAALSMVLDFFIPSIGGLKISFKMLPVIILALRRGLVPGLLGGLLWGILQIVLGEATVLGAVQVIVEYILAFSAVGLAGVFRAAVQKTLYTEGARSKTLLYGSVATFIGSLARYVFHFIAGFWFWGEYAPEGMSPVVNSIVVNGKDFLIETACTIVIFVLLTPLYDRILRVKR